MSNDRSTPPSARVRKLGLLKAAASLLVIYLSGARGLTRLLDKLSDSPRSPIGQLPHRLFVFLMAAPYVALAIGLWELATGKPFRLLEFAWGRLKEWQQGLLSFLLLCLAIGLLLLVVHLITGAELF